MTLAALVSNYGYAAIAVGTFFEGETILILGGLAAHQGYLELPGVIASAFLGTMLGDQLYFYIGRIKGYSVLEKRPRWKRKSARVLGLLKRHQILLILGFRFLYGTRTITPFLIGISKVSPVRFLVLNIIGASVWATVIGGLGYAFGQTLESLIGDIKKYELLISLILVAIGALIWIVYYVMNKR